MQAKRNHLGVENSFHWVLDLALREDESRAIKDYSAEDLNVVRQIAYNSFKYSFTDKQFKCLLDSVINKIVVM